MQAHVKLGETYIARAAYALAAGIGLAGPKLPLPLQLCKLCLLGQNLIATLLHCACPSVPWRDWLIVEGSTWWARNRDKLPWMHVVVGVLEQRTEAMRTRKARLQRKRKR